MLLIVPHEDHGSINSVLDRFVQIGSKVVLIGCKHFIAIRGKILSAVRSPTTLMMSHRLAMKRLELILTALGLSFTDADSYSSDFNLNDSLVLKHTRVSNNGLYDSLLYVHSVDYITSNS